MKGSMRHHLAGLLGLALATAVIGTTAAAPGDVHRVTAERVNLRSGPSDQATVRSTVEQGDELVELRRDDGWLGVRVTRTGEEGWIYGDLVEQVSRSQLNAGVANAGFQTLSEDFDRLIGSMGEQFGYRLFDNIEQAGNNTLRVTPSPKFLLDGSGEAHMATALAIYEMWKNHQNGAPVTVVMLNDRNEDYITVRDGSIGPQFAFETPTASVE